MTSTKSLPRWLPQRKNIGLRRRLLESHLIVAGIGLAVLGVALGWALWQRSHISHLTRVRAVVLENARGLQIGVQRAEVALAGWVTLGDSRFKVERHTAWQAEIEPRISELRLLREHLAADCDDNLIGEIDTLLDDLHQSQWWVEDVAQTVGNEPARLVLSTQCVPISTSMMSSLEQTITREASLPYCQERKLLLGLLADLRFGFTAALVELTSFINGSEVGDTQLLRSRLDSVNNLLQEIDAQGLLRDDDRKYQAAFAVELRAFEEYSNRAIEIRQSEKSNIARHILARETSAVSKDIHQKLDALATSQSMQFANAAEDVETNSVRTISLLLALGCIMAISASSIASRNSTRITLPLFRLNEAAQALASGKVTEDISTTEDDEVGQVTSSFNTMRAAIVESQSSIRQYSKSVEEQNRQLIVREQALEATVADLKRANQELDEFTHVASHDLQEPVRKLVSFSTLLERDLDGELNEAAKRDLTFITEAAVRMKQLVLDLLRLSRAGRSALKSERVSLDECVTQALDDLAIRIEEVGAEITKDPLPDVIGDPTTITQLYQNLLSNALKFCTENKPVIHLSAEHDTDKCILGVADNGIGINDEYAERVFAPFERLHSRAEYEGTGIGLAICKKTIHRHGGTIWVESRHPTGSHFKFVLRTAEHPRCQMNELHAKPISGKEV